MEGQKPLWTHRACTNGYITQARELCLQLKQAGFETNELIPKMEEKENKKRRPKKIKNR